MPTKKDINGVLEINNTRELTDVMQKGILSLGNKQFLVTVGTIFHNTKLPILKWFFAISIIVNAKVKS